MWNVFHISFLHIILLVSNVSLSSSNSRFWNSTVCFVACNGFIYTNSSTENMYMKRILCLSIMVMYNIIKILSNKNVKTNLIIFDKINFYAQIYSKELLKQRKTYFKQLNLFLTSNIYYITYINYTHLYIFSTKLVVKIVLTLKHFN